MGGANEKYSINTDIQKNIATLAQKQFICDCEIIHIKYNMLLYPGSTLPEQAHCFMGKCGLLRLTVFKNVGMVPILKR